MTKANRFLNLLSWTLAVLGVVTLLIINAFYGYENMLVWVIGLALVVAGIVVNQSLTLIDFLNDMFRL